MASLTVVTATDYAGGQSPADRIYIGKSPFGLTDDRSSSLNDLLSIITKNIADLTLGFQDGAAGSVSAASQGKLRYNNSVPGFQASLNGAAYDTIATLTGTQTLTNKTLGAGTIITERLGVTPVAASSGVAPYLRIVAPADTAQTANTEFPGIFLGGSSTGTTVTRQGADGTTYALQREIIAPAPTYAFVGATTVTDAVTLEVGAPIQGANATLTRRAHYGWNGADGAAIAIHGRNVDLGTNQVIVAHDSGGQVRLELMRDRLRFFESEGQIINTFGSGAISIGSGNTSQRVMVDSAGLVGINKASSIGAQLHAVSGDAARIGAIVDSASSPTADIFQARQNASSTARFAVKPDGMYTYPGSKILSTQFDKTNTTYATITDGTSAWTFNVRAGRRYIVLVQMNLTLNATGGGKIRFSGTATMTGFGVQGLTFDNTANSVIGAVGVTFGGDYTEGLSGSPAAGISVTLRGSFIVNAAGTFTVEFAQQTASGTSTVNAFPAFAQIIECDV